MNAEKRRSLNVAFVLDEERLLHLDDILLQLEKPRQYEITFADDYAVQVSDVKSVLRQADNYKHPIKEIDVTTPISEKPNVRVIAGKARDQYTIYYSIAGSETEVPYLDLRLDQWINEIRPWYAWLVKLDIIFTLAAVLCVASLLLVIFFGVIDVWLFSRGIPVPVSAPRPIEPSLALTVAGLIAGLLLITAIVLGVVRGRLFPTVQFALGPGLRRYQRIVRARQMVGVLLAIIFTLLCGIFVNWIARG